MLKLQDVNLGMHKETLNQGKQVLSTVTETRQHMSELNVLYYELEHDAWCCVRPSGTEPKVKFYMGVKEEGLTQAEHALEGLKEAMTKIVQ